MHQEEVWQRWCSIPAIPINVVDIPFTYLLFSHRPPCPTVTFDAMLHLLLLSRQPPTLSCNPSFWLCVVLSRMLSLSSLPPKPPHSDPYPSPHSLCMSSKTIRSKHKVVVSLKSSFIRSFVFSDWDTPLCHLTSLIMANGCVAPRSARFASSSSILHEDETACPYTGG